MVWAPGPRGRNSALGFLRRKMAAGSAAGTRASCPVPTPQSDLALAGAVFGQLCAAVPRLLRLCGENVRVSGETPGRCVIRVWEDTVPHGVPVSFFLLQIKGTYP